MTELFDRILGITGNEKRIYYIDQDHLTEEEFQQGVVISEILWAENGLINALGPTWNMIHDPRFQKIENAFIVERQGLFGGDASAGRQYITYHSQFQLSSIAELEQYAEILGEGRHFRKIIMADRLDPVTFYKESDSTLWKYIRQECPNYFDRGGNPNMEATRLFNLFKADLVGLIHDYAEVPYCNEWVDLESGSLADSSSEFSVFAEVDFLERALTLRASLRSTALKVLNANGGSLKKLLDKVELTDYESDKILQTIYSTEYSKLYTLPSIIADMVNSFMKEHYEERLQRESEKLKAQSQEFCHKLMTGEIENLKPDMEIVEANQSEEEKLVQQIMDDPLKNEAFMLLVELEKNGNDKEADELKKMLLENSESLTVESITKLKQQTIGQRVAASIKPLIQP